MQGVIKLLSLNINICVTKYVTRKIVQENVSVIKCPDIACKAIIKPKFWREIVPKQVLDQLENNALFSGSMKLHCPYKDCSAMLVYDGSENVIDSECPNCRRLFCAQCNVSWHEGLECKDFQRLGRSNDRGKGDVMLMGIAKNKKWRKCPKCVDMIFAIAVEWTTNLNIFVRQLN
ncbi:hypothetical protein KY290_019332 [Solanum tuberosum]|uniref:RBR-type E3 ubiquitin transferase n=1 Tax=Solanum tuberosum TaxID=4113 RepID=A0ABQ7VGQ5_SOLTU|nr:hypothetical protein KY284_018283 [Solanum tuberosum]KAH0763259.1 hypothetical protein KY290_019332 [Solanum tuberosum]